jgi:hypothetical protein
MTARLIVVAVLMALGVVHLGDTAVAGSRRAGAAAAPRSGGAGAIAVLDVTRAVVDFGRRDDRLVVRAALDGIAPTANVDDLTLTIQVIDHRTWAAAMWEGPPTEIR